MSRITTSGRFPATFSRSSSPERVTETVVPGQTRTSPPLANRNTVVSLPAVRDDPAANRLSGTTTSPIPLLTGTTAGAAAANTCGGWNGDFLLSAFRSEEHTSELQSP